MPEKKKNSEIPGDLWVVSGKLRSLGETLSMASGEPPFSNEGLKGLSHFLLELADEVDEVRGEIERTSLIAR